VWRAAARRSEDLGLSPLWCPKHGPNQFHHLPVARVSSSSSPFSSSASSSPPPGRGSRRVGRMMPLGVSAPRAAMCPTPPSSCALSLCWCGSVFVCVCACVLFCAHVVYSENSLQAYRQGKRSKNNSDTLKTKPHCAQASSATPSLSRRAAHHASSTWRRAREAARHTIKDENETKKKDQGGDGIFSPPKRRPV